MITPHVELLAKTIARKENLLCPEIEIASSNKGDGFRGEIFSVIIRSSEGKVLELIVKCGVLDSNIIEKFHLKEVFENEKHFYEIIFPILQQFQESISSSHQFKSVAKFYGSLFERNIRIIALENLRTSKFELIDKKSQLDRKHVEKIICEYGRLHGAVFAYKDRYPEDFDKLINKLHDSWSLFSTEELPIILLQKICNEVVSLVSDFENEEMKQLFLKYADARSVFQEIIKYKGRHPTLNHGDCWSNNFMFKYKNDGETKQLEELCILDWQMCSVGSPVYDLSYFLYSTSSKSILDELEVILNVYHASLSKTIRGLGGDPERLYPYLELKSEWKQYCSFGFLLGLLIQRIRLINNEEMKDNHNIMNPATPEESSSLLLGVQYEKECFENRARDLVLHMYEIDAL